MISVFTATGADLDALAAALTEAFDRDPFSRWVVPDATARGEGMRAMFGHRLAEVAGGKGIVHTTEDRQAAAVWLPPGELDPLEGPPDARPEVAAAFAAIAGGRPEGSFWYLEFLGAARGQGGRGSALVAHMLAVTDATAMPTALWTGNERNLDFYGKHGYGALRHFDFGEAQAWWLWRDAR